MALIQPIYMDALASVVLGELPILQGTRLISERRAEWRCWDLTLYWGRRFISAAVDDFAIVEAVPSCSAFLLRVLLPRAQALGAAVADDAARAWAELHLPEGLPCR